MVYVEDKKFACATCIKGHRSSTCQHLDRPLFEIKPKGRPVSQCEHCRELRKTKQVHVKCECEPKRSSKRTPAATSATASTSKSAQGEPVDIVTRKGAKKVKTLELATATYPHGLPDVVQAATLLTSISSGDASASNSNSLSKSNKSINEVKAQGKSCECDGTASNEICSCCSPRFKPKAHGRSPSVSKPPHIQPALSLQIPTSAVSSTLNTPLDHTPSSSGLSSAVSSSMGLNTPQHHALDGHQIGGGRHSRHSSLYSPYSATSSPNPHYNRDRSPRTPLDQMPPSPLHPQQTTQSPQLQQPLINAIDFSNLHDPIGSSLLPSGTDMDVDLGLVDLLGRPRSALSVASNGSHAEGLNVGGYGAHRRAASGSDLPNPNRHHHPNRRNSSTDFLQVDWSAAAPGARSCSPSPTRRRSDSLAQTEEILEFLTAASTGATSTIHGGGSPFGDNGGTRSRSHSRSGVSPYRGGATSPYPASNGRVSPYPQSHRSTSPYPPSLGGRATSPYPQHRPTSPYPQTGGATSPYHNSTFAVSSETLDLDAEAEATIRRASAALLGLQRGRDRSRSTATSPQHSRGVSPMLMPIPMSSRGTSPMPPTRGHSPMPPHSPNPADGGRPHISLHLDVQNVGGFRSRSLSMNGGAGLSPVSSGYFSPSSPSPTKLVTSPASAGSLTDAMMSCLSSGATSAYRQDLQQQQHQYQQQNSLTSHNHAADCAEGRCACHWSAATNTHGSGNQPCQDAGNGCDCCDAPGDASGGSDLLLQATSPHFGPDMNGPVSGLEGEALGNLLESIFTPGSGGLSDGIGFAVSTERDHPQAQMPDQYGMDALSAAAVAASNSLSPGEGGNSVDAQFLAAAFTTATTYSTPSRTRSSSNASLSHHNSNQAHGGGGGNGVSVEMMRGPSSSSSNGSTTGYGSTYGNMLAQSPSSASSPDGRSPILDHMQPQDFTFPSKLNQQQQQLPEIVVQSDTSSPASSAADNLAAIMFMAGSQDHYASFQQPHSQPLSSSSSASSSTFLSSSTQSSSLSQSNSSTSSLYAPGPGSADLKILAPFPSSPIPNNHGHGNGHARAASFSLSPNPAVAHVQALGHARSTSYDSLGHGHGMISRSPSPYRGGGGGALSRPISPYGFPNTSSSAVNGGGGNGNSLGVGDGGGGGQGRMPSGSMLHPGSAAGPGIIVTPASPYGAGATA